jgi:hypothetical protein
MHKRLAVLIILALFACTVFAADDNLPYSEERQAAVLKINLIKEKITTMEKEGFAVTRLNDEFFILRQVHENNLFKISNQQAPDFDAFDERAASIEKIMENAYQVKDELTALAKSLEEASLEINVSEPKEMYLEAEKEFADERYEFALTKIDATYEKIIELQGVQAKANAAYEATRKNLTTFAYDNRYIISVIVIVPLIIYAIFRRKIKRHFITSKISAIEFESNVLKNEIKRAQQIYFVEGKIPEGEYSIKVKLYGDKIRDLNRQVALLQEELEKLYPSGKKKEDKQKKK